ncbi:MAG: hypothetical protein ACI9EF_003436 [Pseudohongiellaceae bacterium]
MKALVAHDGGFYAGGEFLFSGAAPINHIARLVSGGGGDDSSDSAVSWVDVDGGTSGPVFCISSVGIGGGAWQYAGGWFSSVGSAPLATGGIARWKPGTWEGIGSTTTWGNVYDIASFDDGGGADIYATGNHTAQDDISRWDGLSWTPLGEGLTSNGKTLSVFNDGTGESLWVGGVFTSAGLKPCSRVARWSGSDWFPTNDGLISSVDEMTSSSFEGSPALYIIGPWWAPGTVDNLRVARREDGVWSGIGGISSGDLRAIVEFDDGSGPAIYVAGNFDTIGGVAAESIARWDGTTWSSVGGGLDSNVYDLDVVNDGSGPALWACGGLYTAGGTTPVNKVAAWDGSSWSDVGGGLTQENGGVYSMTVHDFGGSAGPRLVVGGFFTSIEASTTSPGSHLATYGGCWDGVNAWSDLGYALPGDTGDPLLEGTGTLALGSINDVDLSNAKPSATAGLFMSFSSTPTPFAGGTLVPFPFLDPIIVTTSPLGTIPLSYTVDACFPAGITLYMQWVIDDDAAVAGYAMSNAVVGVTP